MGSKPTARRALIERFTKETKVQVSLSLDGGPLNFLPDHSEMSSVIPDQQVQHHASQDSPSQQIWIWTGVGFLDHMLHALAKHAGWSLRVRTSGDLAIDDHHTVEDTFLGLGGAFSRALGDRKGLRRFGDGHAPLDEALGRAVIDISSRPYFVGEFGFKDAKIGALTTQMIRKQSSEGREGEHSAKHSARKFALQTRISCARLLVLRRVRPDNQHNVSVELGIRE
ncbi:hypothetical protein GP486_001689 [Trichoglossum hirsutum]|uniref:Imidazoleglycerol-phosphate dehydratase n=1 Tax=Trichoglossum hirsutum TaxID=265104 RepID=A0A9P8LG80_9PEZI|nr:hypothetical protein GP486_001689 [Trichoglossum hirsutum]